MPFQKGHKSFRTKQSYKLQGQKMIGRFVSQATREKIKLKATGRKFSKEFKEADSKRVKELWKKKWYRNKLVKAHLGQKAWNKGKKFVQISEKNHWNWKGDKVGYHGVHSWIRKLLGKPNSCEHCGGEGRYNGSKWSIHWANKSQKYLRDLTDWMALCVKCHRRYDRKNTNIIINQ